jgi:hypothetical protein
VLSRSHGRGNLPHLGSLECLAVSRVSRRQEPVLRSPGSRRQRWRRSEYVQPGPGRTSRQRGGRCHCCRSLTARVTATLLWNDGA